ncbi:conserved exported protein of unknown function [Tenacibaculum sp. 190130A14a]|uniref:DUF6438 domain-containing protein n=1 Tax=Tenacibaculum polynesiense TaxID=3137857 RepID=A0ABM9PBZ5_9FLAO
MWKNSYIIFFFTVIFFSCSAHKDAKSNTLLYYGKTRCLGKCPVFDMYIYEDGTLFYEGFENVSVIGKKELKLSSKDLSFLKEELNKLSFTVQNQQKRDLPNIILKYNGKKMITQDRNKLKTLLDFLEKVTP